MKLNVDPRMMVAGGVQSVTEFTIKGGAGIMAILSGLYSDPVLAMVREYLTNMYDAHVALRKLNPAAADKAPKCRIAVPSNMAPELVFEDFGIGMSLQTVLEVYTQYGNSTKNDSDDEVGGFGLGAKTAFCYNNGSTWTIESRHGGQKHVFMACVSANGVPSMAHVTSEPSAEHTGVTIRIPILRQDIEKAKSAVATFAPHFPLPLQVEGMIVPDLWKNLVMEGTGWKLVSPVEDRTYYNSKGELYVVMGNVPYEVEWHAFQDNKVFTDWLRSCKKDLYLYVPVGAVNIVPSRDALQYTERTKKALATAINAYMVDLSKSLSTKLDSCKTKWEAILLVNKLESEDVVPKGFPLTWNGQTINSNDGVTVTVEQLQKKDKTATFTVLGIAKTDYAKADYLGDGKTMNLKAKNTFLVLADVPKGAVGAARKLISDNLVHRGYAGKAARYGHKLGHVVILHTKLTDQQVSDLFDGYPVDMMHKASAFVTPRTVRVVGGKRVRGPGNIYEWLYRGWSANAVIDQNEKEHFYLVVDKEPSERRYSWANGNQYETDSYIDSAKSLLKHKGKVYGIRKDEVVKLDATWKNLETEVATHLVAHIKANQSAYAATLLLEAENDVFYEGLGKNVILPLFPPVVQKGLKTKGKLDGNQELLCKALKNVSPLFKAVLDAESELRTLATKTNDGNIGRLLFSRSNRRLEAKFSDEILDALKDAVKNSVLPDKMGAWDRLVTKYPLVIGMAGLVSVSSYNPVIPNISKTSLEAYFSNVPVTT